MKTKAQLIKELPESLVDFLRQEKCLTAFKRNISPEFHELTIAVNPISKHFNWGWSPQGYDFWMDIMWKYTSYIDSLEALEKPLI